MHKSLRKSLKRAAVLAALSLSVALFPKYGQALDPIMPLGEVQQGMQGTAYTVVDSSREIRTFGVDIINPINRGKGDNPLIMARAYGPVVEAAGGILQGMSGSPVYVDGYLIGAVALGYKDMTPFTFFITPIEEMTKLWSMPDLKNKTHIKTIDLKKYLADRQKKEEKEAAEAKKDVSVDEKADAKELEKATEGLAASETETLAETADGAKDAAEAEKAGSAKPEAGSSEAETAGKTEAAGKAETAAKADTEKAKSHKDKDKGKKAKKVKKEKAEKAEATAEEKAGDKADSATAETASAKETAGKDAQAEGSSKEAKDETGDKKDLLFLSGFDAQGKGFLEKQLDAKGFQFMPVDVASTGDVNTDYQAALVPGSSVGVAVAYGDFAISGVGTVTATEGKKIVAFGHSFLHRGNVNFFMTDANVYGTIAGISSGMKVAGVGNIIGRINQDRDTGIAGILGEYPSVVPIHVRVKDLTLGRDETYTSSIAYDEDILPALAATIAYGAIAKTSDTVSAATADVKFSIRTNVAKGGLFERQNMFFGNADVGQTAVNELLSAVGIICTNKDKESDILDVKVDVTMENGRKTASIVSAIPEKTTVKPGETVTIKTTIKPYRRDEETLLIPYKVADTQPAGTLHLDVRGGGYVPQVSPLLILAQAGSNVQLPDGGAEETTEQQLQDLKDAERNNVITIAPGAPAQPMTAKEKRKMLQAAKKAAAEQQKLQAAKKFDPLAKKSDEKPGQVQYATKYIIDNVVHTTLTVEKK